MGLRKVVSVTLRRPLWAIDPNEDLEKNLRSSPRSLLLQYTLSMVRVFRRVSVSY